ncbi:MAG: beta-ketoacyl synthase N-terminal-like domain-containing protein [Desulfobacterium sp.]
MTLHNNKIAVVGLSGIFPGANDVDAFGKNIMAKKEAILDVPPGRWAIPPDQVHSTTYLPDKVASKRAGLITDFAFDPHGFALAPELLLSLDPLHHLVLSAGQQAISHCHCPKQLKAKTGVILAAIALPTQCTSDIAWQVIMENRGHELTRDQALAAGVVSVPAALLARAMGFQGGCFTLDAACASSLFAIKLACDQLTLGRADMMIAGGVSRPDSLYTQIGFTQLKALSPSGRCSPFDRQADGLVVGEGTGMVVLKRMADALACGDTIHGVITGAGWSNDIGGNLVAPASDGQIRAMAAAYKQAGWSPNDVQHIECHGSATPVGDGVELNSMKTLWEDAGISNDNNATCAIGSVKSMVGHLLTAAGAAGFIKTLMAMKANQLPPSLNFTAPPENSPLYQTPFRVQSDPEPWVPRSLSGDKSIPRARRAGISAFGFGGINAHVLVEEFRKEIPTFYYTASKVHKKPLDHSNGVAVVGMALTTPRAADIDTLKQLMVSPEGDIAFIPESPSGTTGQWIDEIKTFAGEFHIPPNQIPDLLPQHLVMLKAAMAAIKDAGIAPRLHKDQGLRTRFGAAIGIEFDHGATDFHLRWLQNHGDKNIPSPHPAGQEIVPESNIPPLTANRTLGALGGIVASRIAREFQLGGPCFTLSADANSGVKALEVGINAIQAKETDLFLCGAVDMAGDMRQTFLAQSLDDHCHYQKAPRGNKNIQNPPWSEGAVAVVLKPLEKAMADGDRIYSVITATASTSGGEMAAENPSSTPALEKAWEISLGNALDRGNISFSDINFHMLQAHGIGHALELGLLEGHHQSPGQTPPPGKTTDLPTTGTVSRILGHTFGISGFVSMVQASLGLYYGLKPSMQPYSISSTDSFSQKNSASPTPGPMAPWVTQSSTDATPHACVTSITRDGACGHVILKAFPRECKPLLPEGIMALSPGSHPETRITPDSTSLKNTRWSDSTPEDSPKNMIALKAHRFPSDKIIPLHFTDQRIDATWNNEETLNPGDALPHDPREAVPHDFPRSNAPANFPGKVLAESVAITGKAHMKFLELSSENTRAFETQFKTLTRLASALVTPGGYAPDVPMDFSSAFPSGTDVLPPPIVKKDNATAPGDAEHTPLFDRHQCLAFAVGNAGTVMGEKFDVIDTYPVRVRLPDEPLMLVDRIISIEGEMLSMGPGKIITQHDVKPGAWYLDGGKAPVSISIEAGQADLFLCSWMGIDHQVKGHRRYRLLDARVTFHRPLPQPGETIEYHIVIDRFLKQGEVYLFFFHYEGYIDNTLFISMRDGCAGFFTPLEVENSGGIILKKEETVTEKRFLDFQFPVQVQTERYTENQVESLRRGDLETCFGSLFKGLTLGKKLRLPRGRMHLIDRVMSFDPTGGRFGLGIIVAEADIQPDDWFLTCHFVDDKVMPGTLMYECCAHALRIFTQRVGWISPRNDVHYDIIPGMESDLKCRGPVTPETKKARYEIEIKEMGYHPEPFVVADAHMFSDDHRIVLYKNMGMKLVGLSRQEIEGFWSNR